MDDLDSLLAAPLLDEVAAEEFAQARARVSSRHLHWRGNFDAVGQLLDSDEERAHALAGNYATEARETVGVWLSVLERSDDNEEHDLQARVRWAEGFWRAWRSEVFATDAYRRLQDGPRERFTLVFDDLMDRFCSEATAHIRARPGRDPVRLSLLGRLLIPFRRSGAAFRGFFLPRLGD